MANATNFKYDIQVDGKIYVYGGSGGNSDQWNSAYLWGNHTVAGYITSSGVTYQNLSLNGSVGTGSTQVSIGNHSHGNILTGGTITSTAISPANTDYILLSDASNGGKIERGILIGTETTTFLRNDGTWSTPPNNTYFAGTGLTLSGSTFSVIYGTTAGSATQGNDSRLSDARTPLSHNHGNINNDGTIVGNSVGATNGDFILIADASDSARLRPSIAIGTGTGTYLRNDGTWATPPNTTYLFGTGSTNGAFEVKPSTGSTQSVSIFGLGTNAYNSTAFLPLTGGTLTSTLIIDKSVAGDEGWDDVGIIKNNTVLDIQGTQGQLFSVTDSLSGDLFKVSDITGIPIFSINSSGAIKVDGDLILDATTVTGTNGDYLIISDTSNGDKLTRGIAIGTGTTTYLRNDGTWATPPQGTVTSVSGTGSYGGLTLTGTVTSTGNLTLGGTPTGTWPISVSGNSATVTNGVYTSGSYSDPTWLTISKSKVGLGSVENTALSTWTGSTSITTLGTISTGTVPWARLSNVPSSFTPSSHNHGNINNDGTIVGNSVGATNGDFILIADASDSARLRPSIAIGTGTGTYLRNDGTWSTPPQGTVTSIATTAPISGGTITGSGTISLADNYGDTKNPYASKTAKYFLAAPNGAAGVPTFRAIVASDIPTLNQSTNGSAGSVANAVTFSNSGGASPGITYDGSGARTIDYSTVGAAPAAHSHGNITNDGKIGTTSGLMITTTTAGTLTTLAAGTTSQYLRGDGTWSTPPQGTVTSVSGTGSYGGLTLTGTVTSSGNLTLGGTPTGTWPISVSGNSATVTNGVYTTGSYSDPSWLTISKSKVGLGSVENTALSTWGGSTNITTLGTISTGTVPWARLSGVPSSFTPSGHTHGNIQNNGIISTTKAIANGDRILIADAGNEYAITTGIQIGTSTTTYLRNDGSWSTPPNDNTTYIFSSGTTNGAFSVKPSSGSTQSVSIYGLGTNAYSSTAYLPLTGGTVSGATRFDTNVGIGITAGDVRLKVVEGGTANYQMRIGASDTLSYDIGRSASDGYLTFYGKQSGSNGYLFTGVNGDFVKIQNNGNVGIGTTAPSYKLQVNGSFAATTKSFVIDHPTKPDSYLRYGSLEGPENGVYIRGRLVDSNTIELPDYWVELVDENTITINLTAFGSKQSLWVKSIKDNKILIGSRFKPINCFYVVYGERKDVDKLEVEIKK